MDDILGVICRRESGKLEIVPFPARLIPLTRESAKATSVAGLALSERTKRELEAGEIATLGDLVYKTEQELLRLPNLGHRGLKEIKDLLGTYWLHLGM